MKKMNPLLIVLATAAMSLPLHAETGHEGHNHGHEDVKKQAGPNGGRILLAVEPHLELFMRSDRILQITALNDDSKAIAIEKQTVSLVGGNRANPVKMTFVPEGGVLLSDKPVPQGNGLPIVLQIKVTPDAKTVIEKFYLNLNECGSCDYKEYACTCGH